MRKLRILEHISLDGVIQSSGEDDAFDEATFNRSAGSFDNPDHAGDLAMARG